MCENTRSTLLAEAPDNSMANDSKKFPTGIREPGINDCDFQLCSLSLHLGLPHDVVISTIVPICDTSTIGLSVLHDGHTLNRSNNCGKDTMNFGCFLRLFSPLFTLWVRTNMCQISSVDTSEMKQLTGTNS